MIIVVLPFLRLCLYFGFRNRPLCDSFWRHIDKPRTSWVLHLCFLLIAECQNYQSLTDRTRRTSYASVGVHCDQSLGPGCFRFQNAAGTEIPTSCVPRHRCGTHAPGWLNGAHPRVTDGKVSRQVCFHWGSNCCRWSVNIQVRNCGSFYVYYLSGTPACNLRFCGAGYHWQIVQTQHFDSQLHHNFFFKWCFFFLHSRTSWPR